jgi:hypothetical protein
MYKHAIIRYSTTHYIALLNNDWIFIKDNDINLDFLILLASGESSLWRKNINSINIGLI